MNVVLYTMTGLLSAFFLFASSIKILGWQKMIFETQMNYMHSYGFNRQILFVIGLMECFGAIAIWFYGTLVGLLGVLALLGPSLGAIFFHLRYDTPKEGAAAMVTATLSALVLYLVYAPF
ncbi:DoxX family protein [Vibrio sp. HN007]|uniref:DoxX family protein n=1 Tax=Vibrio iocasae TaxID=3098914 RepID=UPI0035D407B9